jgi:hypothetical protein
VNVFNRVEVLLPNYLVGQKKESASLSRGIWSWMNFIPTFVFNDEHLNFNAFVSAVSFVLGICNNDLVDASR